MSVAKKTVRVVPLENFPKAKVSVELNEKEDFKSFVKNCGKKLDITPKTLYVLRKVENLDMIEPNDVIYVTGIPLQHKNLDPPSPTNQQKATSKKPMLGKLRRSTVLTDSGMLSMENLRNQMPELYEIQDLATPRPFKYMDFSSKSKPQEWIEPPTGENIAFVFTDIQDSTSLWEQYEHAMQEALEIHNNELRSLLIKYSGYEVKTEGDAFMVVFSGVLNAAKWCLHVQQTLLKVRWPDEIYKHPSAQAVKSASGNILFSGLRVRMGIHYGQAISKVDPLTKRMDYLGRTVNRAARVAGAANGGQIVLSGPAWVQLEGQLSQLGPIKSVDLGSFPFKGLDTEERLVQILPEALGERTFSKVNCSQPPQGKILHLAELSQLWPKAAKALEEKAWNKAKETLQKILALSPKDPVARGNIGFVEVQTGHFQEAENHYRIVAELNPDSPQAFQNLGYCLAQEHNYAEAEKMYFKALNLDSNSKSIKDMLVSLYHEQAQSAMNKNDWKTAYDVLSKVTQFEETPTLQVNLGSCLVNINDRKNAEKHYFRALELDSTNKTAIQNLFALRNNRAFEAMDAEDWETARNLFLEILDDKIIGQINTDSILANIGFCLVKLGQLAEAEEFYRKSLKVNPNGENVKENLNAVLRTQVQDAMERMAWEDSLSVLLKLLPISSEQNWTHNNIGYCLMQLGRFEEAEQHYRESLKTEPDDRTAQANLLGCLSEKANNALIKGNWTLAKDIFLEMLSYNQDKYPLYRNLGHCYSKLGNMAEATKYKALADKLKETA